MEYQQTLNIATLNCRGLQTKTKREWYIHIMEELEIDILCLQETHINTNHTEEKDGHTFIFSTSVTDKDRALREQKKKENANNKNKTNDKGKGKGKGTGKGDRTAMESAGVGFIINKHTMKTVKDFEQISGRNAILTLQTHSNPINIISTYAPQSGIGNTVKERGQLKDQYYEDFKYSFAPNHCVALQSLVAVIVG